MLVCLDFVSEGNVFCCFVVLFSWSYMFVCCDKFLSLFCCLSRSPVVLLNLGDSSKTFGLGSFEPQSTLTKI